MTPPKKPAPAAEPFRVPALAEVSPEYAALLNKQADLMTKSADLSAEKRRLEKQIKTAPRAEYNSDVAALLDEQVSVDIAPRARIAEINREIANIETAQVVLAQRISVGKSSASALVRDAVKPEYARLVTNMAAAINAMVLARSDYDALIHNLNVEDVSWGALVPMHPNFCGDRVDGPIHRWMRDAREAGYVV